MMDRKRQCFKLEMEQISEEIWHLIQSSTKLPGLKFCDKLALIDEIDRLPEHLFERLRETVLAGRDEILIKYLKECPDKFEEFSTFYHQQEEEWLFPEEEEAWCKF